MASETPVLNEHVDVDHVSRNVLAAVIYHEDHDFPTRWQAFNWDRFRTRVERHLDGKEDKSGSTIHHQVVKNLFLTREMSWHARGSGAPRDRPLASDLQHRISSRST